MNKTYVKKVSNELIENDEIQELMNFSQCQCVYVAGSIMEGFGNEKSDIDLFFIGKGLPTKSIIRKIINLFKGYNVFYSKEKIVITAKYKEIDFDLEFHMERDVLEYIDSINKKTAKKKDSFIDFIHRLKFAESIYNTPYFDSLYKKIDFNLYNDIFPRSISLFYAIKSTDVEGAYREKDYQTSFFMAWSLLEDCIDSYLALYGETNPNSKWRIKKINRFMKENTQGIDLISIIQNTFTDFDINDENILKQKTIFILKKCQYINNIIQGDKS